MDNPFKFGTIVEEEYFTDRVEEVAYISQFLNSANHLILISPRRFGKSSVIEKVLKISGRKHVKINMQQVTSVADLSSKLLKEFFKVHPMERVKHLITHFRIIPTVSSNPLTGSIDVSFQPNVDSSILIEDVLTLLENAHTEDNRLIVVFDEFQEIRDISPKLDKTLRAVMQRQKHINYILLGSQESMMTDIFEDKKSPFYHFGELMRLKKLPREDFYNYLSERLAKCYPERCGELSDRILDYTGCHPYYTQQLAANVWQVGMLEPETEDPVTKAIDHIVLSHSLDYERLWMGFNRTNKWIFQQLAYEKPLSDGEKRTSTIYSALKSLQKKGFVIYSDQYEIEDPFFKQWIVNEE